MTATTDIRRQSTTAETFWEQTMSVRPAAGAVAKAVKEIVGGAATKAYNDAYNDTYGPHATVLGERVWRFGLRKHLVDVFESSPRQIKVELLSSKAQAKADEVDRVLREQFPQTEFDVCLGHSPQSVV
jgi:hypothetical protein